MQPTITLTTIDGRTITRLRDDVSLDPTIDQVVSLPVPTYGLSPIMVILAQVHAWDTLKKYEDFVNQTSST